MTVKIYNDDCLNRLNKLKLKKKVDLVVVDLPYAQTACKWDILIDMKKMWEELKKICKRDCVYVFFCTTKFGYKIIQSKEKWFRYDLVWEKSKKVGFLNANKMPLRQHEMMYVFSDNDNHEYDDIDNSRNLGLREYAKKVKAFINKPSTHIREVIGNLGINHFYSFASSQFTLTTEKTYSILIDKFKLKDMPGFRGYKSLTDEWEKPPPKPETTYNPQKTEGKPYKTPGGRTCEGKGVYQKNTSVPIINKGDRHPSTVLKFDNPKKSLHNTQKPVLLLEWLIKTYSNEGDIVLDHTMGSGSTGIACLNTGRDFIGIEKDIDIFKLARDRLLKFEIEEMEFRT